MNPPVLAEIQARLRRLERQNRILVALLGVLAGTASIAATNSIITAGEIRTSHFIIIDNHGKELYEMKGTDGVFKIPGFPIVKLRACLVSKGHV
jgi:hypothetical protein